MGSPFRFSALQSWAVLGLLSGLSLCLGFGFVVGLFHYGAARPSLVADRLPVVPEGSWIAPFSAPTLWTTGEVITPREQPRWVF
ncbi:MULTISPECIES: hypothetical protein [unclassified Pseudomonas]|uniref:hypothetical protein n=1 Tax=unclassified Pseudomonas TaxID=196821 RepID=UPI00128DAE84|nr:MULTISPECIES: hypothetical protein [unclassified Pseudomonas]MPQ70997.1 hypothetical protein [Pseudomonas sp. MWU12-2323]